MEGEVARTGGVRVLSCALLLLGGCAWQRYVIPAEEAAAAVAALRIQDETVVRAVDEKAGAQVRLRLRADDLVTLRQPGATGADPVEFRLRDLALGDGSPEIVFDHWPYPDWAVYSGTASLCVGLLINIGFAIYGQAAWAAIPYAGPVLLIGAAEACPPESDCSGLAAVKAVAITSLILQIVGPTLLLASIQPTNSRIVPDASQVASPSKSFGVYLAGAGAIAVLRF